MNRIARPRRLDGVLRKMHLRLSVSFVSLAIIASGGAYRLGCAAQAAPARKPVPAAKRPVPAKQSTATDKQTAAPPAVDLSGPYNAYLTRLRGKVLPNWDYPPGKFHVVLQAIVNADGSVGEITATSSPHGDAAEKAASAAFSQAQPLEHLPEKSTPTARITINFDSSYDPHGDSNSNMSARLDPIQAPKLQPAAPAAASESTAGAGETNTTPAGGSAEGAGGSSTP